MMNRQNYTGQERVNKLGGIYLTGMPLPRQRRLKILQLVQMGYRPAQVSRQLRVSHSCVSKLLAQFSRTGSIDPGVKSKMNKGRQATSGVVTEGAPGYFRCDVLSSALQFPPAFPDFHNGVNIAGRSCFAEQIKNDIVPHSMPVSFYPQGNGQTNGTFSGTDGKVFFTDFIPPRRRRTKFTATHLHALKKEFSNNPYIERSRKLELALELGISEQKIQAWFCNRRANRRKRYREASQLVWHTQKASTDREKYVELFNSVLPSAQQLHEISAS